VAAQVYIRQEKFEDALEFCDRALHVNPRHVKALSRRAVARRALGKLEDALGDLQLACRLEPENEEVGRQRREVVAEVEDRRAERDVQALKAQAADKVRCARTQEHAWTRLAWSGVYLPMLTGGWCGVRVPVPGGATTEARRPCTAGDGGGRGAGRREDAGGGGAGDDG
jgi:tetratricopeptide (TPR) repeat protein